jgi:hypothetical protein
MESINFGIPRHCSSFMGFMTFQGFLWSVQDNLLYMGYIYIYRILFLFSYEKKTLT